MSDHYKDARAAAQRQQATDVKNAYFRLAHRYHPDHHAWGDAASCAVAAAAFRRAKDAYDVLYDKRRRAEYDRAIRCSSYASGSASSRSSGFDEYCKARKKWAEWDAERKAKMKKREAEWYAERKAEMKKREEERAKRKAEKEKLEAERAKWKAGKEKRDAERAKWKAEQEKRQAEWDAWLESRWKGTARLRGDRATSFSAD